VAGGELDTVTAGGAGAGAAVVPFESFDGALHWETATMIATIVLTTPAIEPMIVQDWPASVLLIPLTSNRLTIHDGENPNLQCSVHSDGSWTLAYRSNVSTQGSDIAEPRLLSISSHLRPQ